MNSNQVSRIRSRPSLRPRVLAIADWTLDPRAVADSLRRYDSRGGVNFQLIVPPRLRGISWVGDPYASRPCAERQLAELQRLCHLAGLHVNALPAADPEPMSVVSDALDSAPVDSIVIFDRQRRRSVSHPMSLARRVARRTGIPVRRITVGVGRRGKTAAGRVAKRCDCPDGRS